MKEAMFYEKLDGKSVRCGLCRFCCLIREGERGVCAVRENRDGVLYSLVYNNVCTEQIDPIEKKPLFHVLPGSTTYSVATVGCNFQCRHCQNFSISMLDPGADVSGYVRTPEDVVKQAVASGCRSIAYTYTEPTIFFEFAYDTARLARSAGLKNIFVTNGYISKEALTVIAPFLDAANIDLKGFSEEFYSDVVHARLSGVLDSLVEYHRLGIWLEITTLIIPGLNDSDDQLKGIAAFIADRLGVDTPWHVSRFHPAYRLTDRPGTSPEILRRARDIGRAAGLNYVYEGNVPGEGGENTVCPSCSALLIQRYGYRIESSRIRNGACPDCGTVIAGIGM